MYEIEFHNDADAEMREAARYCDGQVTGLGDDFLDEIEESLNRIRQFPLLWSVYEGEYRRCLLKRFPYGLIYRIGGETVDIIAVAHGRRMPGC